MTDHIGSIAIGIYLLAGIIGGGLLVAKIKPFTKPAWLVLTPPDLLRNPIAAEIVIHVMGDMSKKVYATKLITLPPQAIAKVTENIIAAGMELGQQHGIQVHLCTRPEHQEGAK